MKNLYKKFKKGGQLFIYVPAFNSLFSEFDKKVGHFRRYTKNNLSQKCKDANFKIINCEYVDFLGGIIAYLYKYIGRNGELNTTSLTIFDTFIFPISRICDKIFGKYFFGKNLAICLEKQ